MITYYFPPEVGLLTKAKNLNSPRSESLKKRVANLIGTPRNTDLNIFRMISNINDILFIIYLE
jgi:hypothetical protein